MRGIVKEIKDNHRVIVNLDMLADCKTCALSKTCLTTSNCNNLIEAICYEDVRVGDIVYVKISPLKRIVFSLLIFFVPIIFLFLSYFIIKKIFSNELIAIIFSFIAIILYFGIFFFIYRIKSDFFKIDSVVYKK